MTETATSPAWFRRHFNEDYLVLYSGRSREQAEEEVDFVVRRLRIRPDETVLDLCCGFGRHLQAFRQRGIAAVGVDLSASLLSVARRSLDAALVCADMRQLPFAEGAKKHGFSVLVNFFTSFGYFEDDRDNARAAAEMSRVLRPGGRFAVDLMNAEPVIRDLEPLSERRTGPFAIREERSYDARRGRLEKAIRLENVETGTTRKYFESVKVYSEAQARTLLERAGLEVIEVFGDFNGLPRGPETPRMIITGRRRLR